MLSGLRLLQYTGALARVSSRKSFHRELLIDSYHLDPIGFIDSCFRDKFGTPRQPGLAPESSAELTLRSNLQPEISTLGLEGFSHVWLIFWFHLNKVAHYHAKVHPPRMNGQSVGLFATRSPHRPNPMGLSLVKLEKIVGPTLYFSGIDLVHGTPILDIKPYLPDIEAVPEARSGWAAQAANESTDIEFSHEALTQLQEWQARYDELSKPTNLKKLIIETIQLDPRPLVYKNQSYLDKLDSRQSHAVRLFDGDIHFEYLSPTKALVKEIKF